MNSKELVVRVTAGSLSNSLATPRSATMALRASVRRMFSVLRSRWTMLSEWRYLVRPGMPHL